MTLTNTPVYDEVAFEFADRGVNITEIIERPSFQIRPLDVDVRWRVICERFDKEQGNGKRRRNTRKRS